MSKWWIETLEDALLSILDRYFEYLQEEVCTSGCGTEGCSPDCTSNWEAFRKVRAILIANKERRKL